MPSRPRRVPLLAAGLVTGLGLLSGCGSTGLGTGNDFTVGAALRTLPDVDTDGARVVVGDLGTLRSDAAAHGTEDPQKWLGRLDDVGVESLLPSNLEAGRLATGQVRDVLGFDVRDVVSYASLETPPDRLTVLRLADGSAPKDGLRSTGGGDVGERARGAVASTFPVVLGLGARSGEVALGQDADVLVDWADKGRTLGDEGDLAAVAKALDDKNVVAAELVDGDLRPTGSSSSAGSGASVPEYDAVGVGQALGDEKGEVTTWVAYRSGEPSRLASVVRRTWERGTSRTSDQRLSELATVKDVSTDGDTVLVELKPRRPDAVFTLLQKVDAPFAVDPTKGD